MAKQTATAWYAKVFGDWYKGLGPKPTAAELDTVHVFARPGKQALAMAMALRPDGVTSEQMLNASALFDGKATPHRNKIKAMVAAGMFTREPVPGVYKITLAARGKTFVAQAAKAAANGKADKPAGEVKAAKAPKVKAPRTRKPRKPAVQAPAVDQPAPQGDGADHQQA